MQGAKKKRYAIVGTDFKEVSDSEVDYELTSPNQFFGSHTNLVPLQSAVAAPRVFYGSRFVNQAVPLVKNERPHVQGLIDGDKDGRSFEEYSGDQAGNVRSKIDGVVSRIKGNLISIRQDDGTEHDYDLYDNFSFNRKTGISSKPIVAAGDKVTPNQLLAHSNFTSEDGTLALGTNARVGLIPYKGYSMDDAVVISESFAKKLTSEQLMTYAQAKGKEVKLGKNHFNTLFPKKFSKAQLGKLDDDGVAKPGETLEEGDPIVLATTPRVISSSQQQLGKLSRHMLNSRRDATQTWKYKVPGFVTDIANNRGDIKVNIKSQLPASEGDKMVFRAGQKGTVAKILPDEHMPRTAEGKPLEALLNPLGIPSRVNNSAVYELLLGKIAEKTGKPYKLPQFNDKENWYDFVENELKINGLESTEKVFDPKDDRWIENPITVGSGYVMKLTHMAEGKLSGRGTGSYATGDQSPLKGGDDVAQAKRLSGLEATALLSSGAYKTLKETATLTGTRNDSYWRMVRMGYTPEAPKEPFAWDKFQALIIGTGLHANPVTRDQMRLSPFTDKKLDALGPQEIKKGEIINIKTMSPVEGGLFDNALAVNNKWGKIPLDFPVPNPAFETPIMKLLGVTKNQMMDIMRGKEQIGGQTGPTALHDALANLDLDEMEAQATKDIKDRKKTKRPLAVQRLNYIKGMKKNGVTPADLMVKNVPVIPTKFRPFSMVGETFVPGDANALYIDLLDLRNAHRKTKDVLGEEGAADNRVDVYNAVKALYGFGDAVNAKNKERGFSGFLKQLTGDSPKLGWVNRKLLSKTKDLSGRGVITVDPELEMDEIGIPEKLAWKIYQPFIQRKLVRGGLSPKDSVLAIRDQTPQAKRAMELEMKDRPVMYSRAPVWHKFGILGGWGRLIEGNNISVNPLVTTGLNADFDGDTANVHVPVTDETVDEVKNKLMPSKMLYTIRDENQVMAQPKHETLLGLYSAIKRKTDRKHTFPNRQMALAAIRSGKVRMSDEIEILNEKKAETVTTHYQEDDRGIHDFSKLFELIKDREVEEILLSKLKGLDRSKRTGFSEKRYKNTDLDYPIIVGEDDTVLDGRHRSLKSMDEGKESIRARRVNEDDLKQVRLSEAEKAAAFPNAEMTWESWKAEKGDAHLYRIKLASAIEQLTEAKSLSDKGNYSRKTRVLQKLMEETPDDFEVDSQEGRYWGITHAPTGFRIHVDKAAIPAAVAQKKSPKRKATIIKGNPKYIEGNEQAEAFYQMVAEHLQSKGYDTEFDAGEPHTQPADGSDLWVGHSRGADRLRFAPEGVNTVHLDEFEEDRDEEKPGPNHYTFNDAMMAAIPAAVAQKKTPNVLAHVGGASGSGKTTLLNEMSKQYPDALFKDMDEFDEQAETNLGWGDIKKKDYTDEMLQQLATERQQLLDEFVSGAEKSVVLAGHHTEGPHTLDIPTENRYLLDVDAETSAQRAFDRSQQEDAEHVRMPGEMPGDISEAQEVIDQLSGMGYESLSPDVVRQKIVGLLNKTAAMGKAANLWDDLNDHKWKGDTVKRIKNTATQLGEAGKLVTKGYFGGEKKVYQDNLEANIKDSYSGVPGGWGGELARVRKAQQSNSAPLGFPITTDPEKLKAPIDIREIASFNPKDIGGGNLAQYDFGTQKIDIRPPEAFPEGQYNTFKKHELSHAGQHAFMGKGPWSRLPDQKEFSSGKPTIESGPIYSDPNQDFNFEAPVHNISLPVTADAWGGDTELANDIRNWDDGAYWKEGTGIINDLKNLKKRQTAAYYSMPLEVGVRLAHIKRLFSKETGLPADSPEASQKAMQWYREKLNKFKEENPGRGNPEWGHGDERQWMDLYDTPYWHKLMPQLVQASSATQNKTAAVADAPNYTVGVQPIVCSQCRHASKDNYCSLYNFTFKGGMTCDSWAPEQQQIEINKLYDRPN